MPAMICKTEAVAGPDQPDDSMRGSVHIRITAIVAGVVIGFVGGAFRWCLQKADELRIDFVDWTHHLPGPGWLSRWRPPQQARRWPP